MLLVHTLSLILERFIRDATLARPRVAAATLCCMAAHVPAVRAHADSAAAKRATTRRLLPAAAARAYIMIPRAHAPAENPHHRRRGDCQA